MNRKIMVIFGTRPEAIKMAPIIRAMKDSTLDPIICVTAQHRQMLDQVLSFFEIRPDYDLDLMTTHQTLASLSARVLEGVDTIIGQEQPDAVLVQGDTTTAMTGALAAFYHRIPVGHVEAGLRTYHLYDPYPEEVNRQIISVFAAYHFAPTEHARKALISEGKPSEGIFLTGNTVIDALKWTVQQGVPLPISLPGKDKKIILITAHRRESFGPRFEEICSAIKEIAESRSDIHIIFPVHLNPNVREPVSRILNSVDRVELIEPLPYPQFATLMAHSYFILTDSGGLQEEGPALGKPVLVMRETTERPEAVEAGVSRLVGTNADSIVSAVAEMLDDEQAYRAMATAVSPFGDGFASDRIVSILSKELG